MDKIQQLVATINDPKQLDNDQNSQRILDYLRELKNCQFVFDGDTYCHISGEIIGNKESIVLENKTFNKNDLLAQIMDQFCDCFDEEFEIQSTYYKAPIKIEFDEYIFQTLLGESEFLKLKYKVQDKYEDKSLEESLFVCPITKEEYLKGIDSFIFQNKIISVEGALQIYESNPKCFLQAQKIYLESYKQYLESQKNTPST